MTYTIVALDPESSAMGIGVQSHFFAVGGVVPWLEEGVGIVATQSFMSRAFGPSGLRMLRNGAAAQEVVNRTIGEDPWSAGRQLCVLDASGGIAHWTGANCLPDHGAVRRGNVCALGNMLASERIPEAMVDAFEGAEGALENRLVAALAAAENLGGDCRGSQAAAVITASSAAGSGVGVDLRVDDHPAAVKELQRLLERQQVYGRLGAHVFGDGGPTPDKSAEFRHRALAELQDVAARLTDNLEPVVWRGVLLAQAGRKTEAEACFEAVPSLRKFVQQLSRAGYLEPHD